MFKNINESFDRELRKVRESLSENDFLDLKSDVYNALSDVVFKYREKSIDENDVNRAVEWFMIRFFEDDAEGFVEGESTSYKSKVLKEAPEVTLNSAEMNNPDSIDLRKIARRSVEAEKKAKAEAEKQQRIADIKTKYEGVLAKANEVRGTYDCVEVLFEALVPSRGISDTVAGELIRAVSRITYRDYNDGDKFFAGYGLETCGGSAQYLHDMGFSRQIDSILDDVYRYADNDTAYTEAITNLAIDVANHILDNPELIAELNETDSRDYDYEYIEESQPTFDYDFQLPGEVMNFIERDCIDVRDIEDIVESNLDNSNIKYDSIDCDYSGGVYIYGLDSDSYSEVESHRMWHESYWEYEISEWVSEFGLEDEDNYDEDDLEESKSLRESPVYDMTPQYDNRKSFYNKAIVDDNGNEKTLYSYNTPVVKIIDGKVELLPKWDWSQTTLRHVKEFLKQNGFEATSLSQIRDTYK